MTTEKTFCIDDLDVRKVSDEGVEIELKNAEGKGLGVFLTILGEQSDIVEKFITELADKRATEAFKAQKNGRPAVNAQQFLDDEVASAAVRVTGWRGLREPFTPENLQRLLRSNRRVVRQILVASSDDTFFTKA